MYFTQSASKRYSRPSIRAMMSTEPPWHVRRIVWSIVAARTSEIADSGTNQPRLASKSLRKSSSKIVISSSPVPVQQSEPGRWHPSEISRSDLSADDAMRTPHGDDGSAVLENEIGAHALSGKPLCL